MLPCYLEKLIGNSCGKSTVVGFGSSKYHTFASALEKLLFSASQEERNIA